ncbi:MAG: GNAT family N-acetyltransferase [Bacteroidetes bacterium]|nr:GNAT family N-acetyltransferase [Bacteroidota bacterium]
MKHFDLQPLLENEFVKLLPLQQEDFEELYTVAADPLIWEQHPNKDRWKREIFENFFKGAMESKGAFKIIDKLTGKIIGSTRFYTTGKDNSEIAIGYTFFARNYWGGKYNPAVKKMMMDHAFKYVNHILFHIGAVNVRSQKAIERLGAVKIAAEEMAYYGEASKLNFVYRIDR